MIGVKMRDEDDVDVIAIDRKLVHGNQRRRPAIDQCVDVRPYKVKAGIESPARAESVAAADELQVHANSQSSANGSCRPGVIGTSRCCNVASGRPTVRDLYHNASDSDGRSPKATNPMSFQRFFGFTTFIF
jgi:hypothetical protein